MTQNLSCGKDPLDLMPESKAWLMEDPSTAGRTGERRGGWVLTLPYEP